ncbi:MAG: aminotransferase class III-fold pyridoxal phosphate-dependent enzyme [Candidatus Omnitrophota bacterium]
MKLTAVDRKIAQEIQPFVPDNVFDVHSHIYRTKDLDIAPSSFWKENPAELGIEDWRRQMEGQMGRGKLRGGLFIPPPFCTSDKASDFVVNQLKKFPESKGLILTSLYHSKETALRYLENPRIAGFKPYHTFSKDKPTWQADLNSYLPEWAWKTAHDRGLVILLHLVKDLALADPDNQRAIREKCRKYPRAKLILAHAGRGFHYLNTIKGISALRGLENIWFDTAAICEPFALIAILQEFGPKKLLWGSDFPVSNDRGRCATAGDGFVWLTKNSVKWEQVSPVCNPTLVVFESLRALKEAADIFGLNTEDIRDIFGDNSRRLLGLKEESGTRTQELYRYAKKRIPGGNQLLSKRPEMMAPDVWPAYFSEARGCEVWDLDGKHYWDMSICGIGSCLLGFRDPDVTRAVRRRINLGSMCTLNPPEEVELADLLCKIHPWADCVRFARTGGESAAVAIRIARATTDRSLIAFCGYHGWHDWYLAANLGEADALRGHLLQGGLHPLGVPRELRNTAIPFHYNNRQEFQAVLDRYGDRLAGVVMEPCRNNPPEPGFLEFVRDGIHKCGGLLVFDEISIGWRLCFGGAHLKLGVNPDLAIFAKALGNGHPIGAVVGTRKAMAGAHDSFISSTYWTESVGPAAALATLKKMQKTDLPAHIAEIGTRVKNLWKKSAKKTHLPVKVDDGYPCFAHFGFDHPLSEELRTLYTQLMLERGFLAGSSLFPTLAHNDAVVSAYGKAIAEVFAEISLTLKQDKVKEKLKGPVAHTGFQRLL